MLGRKIKSYDENGYASEYKYDNAGRLIEEKIPLAENDDEITYTVIKRWYDGNGNLTRELIKGNKIGKFNNVVCTDYEYDNMNRLVLVETINEDVLNYTQYQYDKRGSLLRMYTGLEQKLEINESDAETVTDCSGQKGTCLFLQLFLTKYYLGHSFLLCPFFSSCKEETITYEPISRQKGTYLILQVFQI